ncbi:signal peptidase I [Streptomyces sp. A1277]|uniref:signal peptidase I n=1 Tax=Streptomyces sp. A1277 TaxID=2563103 RepID=UPI0010A28094|nr:signal peptidase I [Streptomyces sp. A1277]THA28784.1 signal peptidase I [Streptomyces sp. A1277]
MAVGARSGHEEPEDRPGSPAHAESAGEAADGAAAGGVESDGGASGSSTARKKSPRPFWKELPLLIGVALILALLIKTFLVQAFSIPSDSMQNTLQRGDRVLVDKLTPWFGAEPERGEVVVFHDPGGWLEDTQAPEPNAVQKFLSFIGLMPSSEEKDLIKRVIAIGGDTVECKKNGPVEVNGKALDDKSFIFEGNSACDDEPFGPIKVPKGRMWVMGDHRQNSLDSRYHQNLSGGGTVSTEKVVGRAIVIAWPVNRWATLPVPKTFDQPGINAAAAAAAPGAIGLAGAVPLVLWRRRRRTSPRRAT